MNGDGGYSVTVPIAIIGRTNIAAPMPTAVAVSTPAMARNTRRRAFHFGTRFMFLRVCCSAYWEVSRIADDVSMTIVILQYNEKFLYFVISILQICRFIDGATAEFRLNSV